MAPPECTMAPSCDLRADCELVLLTDWLAICSVGSPQFYTPRTKDTEAMRKNTLKKIKLKKITHCISKISIQTDCKATIAGSKFKEISSIFVLQFS